jgi:hypothetical protein
MTLYSLFQALFPVGRVVATPGALALLTDTATDPRDLLARHVSGDWGDVPAEDAATNNQAVHDDNLMILSEYSVPNPGDEASGGRVWIITDAYRATTTILLPEDY